jgi:hypothetical protein
MVLDRGLQSSSSASSAGYVCGSLCSLVVEATRTFAVNHKRVLAGITHQEVSSNASPLGMQLQVDSRWRNGANPIARTGEQLKVRHRRAPTLSSVQYGLFLVLA